jgi:hypothetical protein
LHTPGQPQDCPELLAVAEDVADQLEDAVFLRSLLSASGVTADSLVCLQVTPQAIRLTRAERF